MVRVVDALPASYTRRAGRDAVEDGVFPEAVLGEADNCAGDAGGRAAGSLSSHFGVGGCDGSRLEEGPDIPSTLTRRSPS